jgi:hypothetical protein
MKEIALFTLSILILLQTTKFEAINSAIILVACFVFLREAQYKTLVLMGITFCACVLFGYFLLVDNFVLLKYGIFLIRFVALLYLVKVLLQSKTDLHAALEVVFYVHCATIILCYAFPYLNDILRVYFSYNGGSQDRITGLVQGYEFVPFLFTIYLAYEYLNFSKVPKPKFLLKLALGTIVSIMSGRYSIVPLALLYAYILSNPKYLIANLVLLSTGVVMIAVSFSDQFRNIMQTVSLILDYTEFGEYHDYSQYSRHSSTGIEVENQYNLSPITLFKELTIPWLNWRDHLFASESEVLLDPGPSYMMINMGLFLTLALYTIFFKSFKYVFGTSIPLIVIFLFLAIDFKFRSLYVLMPSIWLLLNHVNHINQNKQRESRV